MNRRTFTNSMGIGALLGSSALSAMNSLNQKDTGLQNTTARDVYSRQRLESLIGSHFSCDNHPGGFQLIEMQREKCADQFHLVFRASGADAGLTEQIYFLKSESSAHVALHMKPVETGSGTHLVATVNHTRG